MKNVKTRHLLVSVAAGLVLAAAVMAASEAARVGDTQVCPQTCTIGPSIFPHVGQPLQQGSTNVRICGSPAVRVGHSTLCICGGSPVAGAVASGSNTVLINGAPAARKNSTTTHGGVITSGCASVIIGP